MVTVIFLTSFALGFKILELVKGKADLYIHPTGARRWDLCGPQAILEASGGVLRSMTGNRYTFHHSDEGRVGADTGIFAAASRALFKKWAPTVLKLHSALNVKIKAASA